MTSSFFYGDYLPFSKKRFSPFIFWIYHQNGLNILMDDHHLSNITKLETQAKTNESLDVCRHGLKKGLLGLKV
jgi:hypothetical protein